jgi:hypothetical protein
VATTYEVFLTVEPDRSTTALQDVLRSALAGTGERSPQVDRLPEDDAALMVTMWLQAGDSSEARLAAEDRLREALRAAGLTENAAVIRDSAARSSS